MYYSLKDEVQTDAFIEKWYQQKNILLPVVQGEDLILRQYTGKESLQTGAYHIEEPVGEVFSSYQKIDAVIVPGVAFDKKGNRLGRGKGYYDRLLPQLKATKIGICFPFQLVEEVPTEPFDIKMDKIITI
jgi:5-formyltetrahydrofolate cyclo-ligase